MTASFPGFYISRERTTSNHQPTTKTAYEKSNQINDNTTSPMPTFMCNPSKESNMHSETLLTSSPMATARINWCHLLAIVIVFRKLPDDDELVGDQMIVTDKKYAATEKLKTAIRSIMTRVAIKYGNRSGRYRKFGTAKMGDMTDAQLLFCGRRVVRVARAQIDFLADVGVNENNIKRVSDASQGFENALNIQQDKVAERDIAVERRIDLGNKLYLELVLLCNIGKDIWAEKDVTKYENYTIYESNNDQKLLRKERLEAEPKKSAATKQEEMIVDEDGDGGADADGGADSDD